MSKSDDQPSAASVSRRSFIKTAGISAVGASITAAADGLAASRAHAMPSGPDLIGPDPAEMRPGGRVGIGWREPRSARV